MAPVIIDWPAPPKDLALPPTIAPEQLNGPVRLLAGPGTGKTHALVELYARLVQEGVAGRGGILVLTFSTAAAGEIGRRLDERLQDSYDEAWISTFHSFCARLLRDHRPDPGRLLLSGFQEFVAMRGVLAAMDRAPLGELGRVAHTDAFAQDALAFVALLKQNLVHPAEFSLRAETAGTPRLRVLAAVYSAYQAKLEASGLKDFRDLIADAIGLLDALPDLLEQMRERFRYLLVDEFQDVDPAQFALLRRLAPAESRPRLLVAGDPDQSIYGFRGAVPRLLGDEFPRVYGGESLALEVSRRCPASVLEAGERLLRETQPMRARRDLASDRPEPAPSLEVVREANGVDEAFFAAREIRRLMLDDPELRLRDFAILLRSTTTLSAPFEEAVRALGLAYEVRGVGAMARNEVVRFLLTTLHALDRPDEPEALERFLSSGLSGVGPRPAGRLRRHAIEEGRAFDRVVRRLMYHLPWPLPWNGEPPPPLEEGAREPEYLEHLPEADRLAIHTALTAFYKLARDARGLPVTALAYLVLIETGALARLLQLPLDGPDREEALADLRTALEAFAELEEVWGRLHGAPPLLADVAPRLDSFVARAVDEAQPAVGARDAVQILTVHQSKGLEFEVVFLAGFAQGIFPVAARPHPVLEEEDQQWLEANLGGFRPSWPSDPEAHLAEEARLAYVGMTRARRRLYLSYAEDYDRAAGSSAFIDLAAPDAPRRELSRSAARLEPAELLTVSEAETLLASMRGALGEPEAARATALGVDMRFVMDPCSGRPYEPYGVGHRPEGVHPDHFSATAINDYLKCPRLYFYNQHPGLVAPPRGVELERGSFLHRVLEDFHTRESEWRTLAPELQREWLDKALETHLERYLGRVDAVLERRAEEQEVRRILDNYIRFATSTQVIRRLGTIKTEQRFRLLVDGAEVVGKIDRINDTGDGTCEVVDYKTGRGSAAQRAYDSYFGPELHDVQLALYYLACQEGLDEEGRPLGLNPRFLSLWYPKDWVYGSIRQVLFPVGGAAPGVRDQIQRPLAEGDLARGRDAVAVSIRRIKAGDFDPAPRETVGTCLTWFGCPHAAICPFGGQPVE